MKLPKPPSIPSPPSLPTPPAPPQASSLPAASADCTSTVQPAQPGAPAQQIAYRVTRASDGKTRMDYGATSVITDPASGKTIVLDHIKKEVRTIPMPQAPAPPPMPHAQIPGLPGAAPQPPSLPPGTTVKDLGKRLVEGHEVEGKQYTMLPPGVPSVAKPPEMPAVPKLKLPGAPEPPKAPEPPQPPVPTVTEAWTSTKLHLPVLTRTTGSFGQQICHCKNLSGAEPPASLFQIPADYKQAIPKPPKP